MKRFGLLCALCFFLSQMACTPLPISILVREGYSESHLPKGARAFTRDTVYFRLDKLYSTQDLNNRFKKKDVAEIGIIFGNGRYETTEEIAIDADSIFYSSDQGRFSVSIDSIHMVHIYPDKKSVGMLKKAVAVAGGFMVLDVLLQNLGGEIQRPTGRRLAIAGGIGTVAGLISGALNRGAELVLISYEQDDFNVN